MEIQVGPVGAADLAEEKGSDHPGRTKFLEQRGKGGVRFRTLPCALPPSSSPLSSFEKSV